MEKLADFEKYVLILGNLRDFAKPFLLSGDDPMSLMSTAMTTMMVISGATRRTAWQLKITPDKAAFFSGTG